MMKCHLFVILFVLLIGGTSTGFAADTVYTISYVGQTFFDGGHNSDCWGWTAPDGTEYALVGYANGIGIVRTTPTVSIVDTIPGPTGGGAGIWRDIKTYGHYAYAVSEASGEYSGLSVIDLQYLPDSAHFVGAFSTNGGTAFTSHNISIDTARGFAYVEGSASEQIRILDLADPEVPTFVNYFGNAASAIHDMYAENDTVYVAEGSAGTWSIWDLSDKMSPQLLKRVTVPDAGYVHNIWPSPDRHYCVTTEETAGKPVRVWDISDYANITQVGGYLGPSLLAHNAFWRGDLIVISHYESGIIIVDATDPTALTEMYRRDTYPAGESPNFHGCWGAYPYTQNGHVYASSIEGSVVVLNIDAECPTPTTPALLSPDDDATGVPQPLTLTWANNSAPAYHVQIAADSMFAAPVIDTLITGASLEVSGLPEYTTHYWRLAAANDCGDGNWSPVRAFTTTCIVALTGDVNQTLSVTSADVIYMVTYVFKGGPEPLPIAAAGDVDCSGTLTSADVIALVNYVFKSASLPCDVCSIL